MLEVKAKLKKNLPLIRPPPITTKAREVSAPVKTEPATVTIPTRKPEDTESEIEDDEESVDLDLLETLGEAKPKPKKKRIEVEESEGEEEESDGESEEEEEESEGEEEEEEEMSPEEQEAYDRDTFLLKFALLRRRHPTEDIPIFTRHSSIQEMKASYNSISRRLMIEDTVASYRQYLIFGFMGVEYVCSTWVGIDMRGFGKNQLASMYKYDKLLFELGLKADTGKESKIPVELRLLGLIVMNACIFIITKKLTEIPGASNMVNAGWENMVGAGPPQPQQPHPQPPQYQDQAHVQRRRPTGPTYSVADIRAAAQREAEGRE